ncbi:MAG: TRAP transporter substrate-binding protein [Thermodesulfobacteriota bacterium]|nr:TRAP transporter substrate-binding protein [Thermodesulfobacteriota bacterium]
MKIVRCFSSFFIIAALGFFSLYNTGTAQANPIALTYANFFPASHVQAKLGQSWAKEIERRTNGAVKITYYPSSILLKGNQIYDGILKGKTDIGMSAFAYNLTRFPAMEAYHLPLGYYDGRANTFIINDFYNRFRPEEFSKVKVLYLHAQGPNLFHSKKPVDKLEDLKNLKIRAIGAGAKEAKALGGVQVSIPMSETYAALQRGVVDAYFAPIEQLKSGRIAEVIRHTVENYSVSYSNGFYVFMNLNKWTSLPQDIQRIFDLVSLEWIAKHGRAWETSDAEGREFSLILGNKITALSESESERWARAVEPVIDAYIEDKAKDNLPARDYVSYIKALIRKYAE